MSLGVKTTSVVWRQVGEQALARSIGSEATFLLIPAVTIDTPRCRARVLAPRVGRRVLPAVCRVHDPLAAWQQLRILRKASTLCTDPRSLDLRGPLVFACVLLLLYCSVQYQSGAVRDVLRSVVSLTVAVRFHSSWPFPLLTNTDDRDVMSEADAQRSTFGNVMLRTACGERCIANGTRPVHCPPNRSGALSPRTAVGISV